MTRAAFSPRRAFSDLLPPSPQASIASREREYGALQNELQTSQLSLKALRQELTQASGPPPTISADLPEAS